MKTIFHPAETRGKADHGWLKSRHTFSFANYYHPDRMGFGALRVLNDDIVAPARGFDTHSHHNMEIVSIPLRGSLEHQDTIGNRHIIRPGEVQIMSAGTGIAHSEYNHSSSEEVNFLQIWILPQTLDTLPGYAQKKFSERTSSSNLQILASPDEREGSLKINQNSFFSKIRIDQDQPAHYSWFTPRSGVYFFLIEGQIKIEDQLLDSRDGLGVTEENTVTIEASQDSEVLIIEVPMENLN